jgi:hypothetical protein
MGTPGSLNITEGRASAQPDPSPHFGFPTSCLPFVLSLQNRGESEDAPHF